MALILLAGLYMMVTAWSGVAWIVVGFWSLVLLTVLAIVLTGPRLSALGRLLRTENGPLSPGFHHLAHHPLLWLSIQLRVAIALGIVFLMTVKPDLGGALVTIGGASILGLAAALPIPSHAHRQ